MCERLRLHHIVNETDKAANVYAPKEVLERQGVSPSLAGHVYGVASRLGHAETRDDKPPARDDAVCRLHIIEAICL